MGKFDGVFAIEDMVEKPTEDNLLSLYAILGRCVLTPEIFDILEKTPLGVGGELQLTDAMAIMARSGGVYALEFEGTRYDLGSKIGFLKANIVKGLEHPETKDELREFLRALAGEL